MITLELNVYYYVVGTVIEVGDGLGNRTHPSCPGTYGKGPGASKAKGIIGMLSTMHWGEGLGGWASK